MSLKLISIDRMNFFLYFWKVDKSTLWSSFLEMKGFEKNVKLEFSENFAVWIFAPFKNTSSHFK